MTGWRAVFVAENTECIGGCQDGWVGKGTCLSSVPRSTWWKEITDPCKLSSDLHMSVMTFSIPCSPVTIHRYTDRHTNMLTYVCLHTPSTNKCNTNFEKPSVQHLVSFSVLWPLFFNILFHFFFSHHPSLLPSPHSFPIERISLSIFMTLNRLTFSGSLGKCSVTQIPKPV